MKQNRAQTLQLTPYHALSSELKNAPILISATVLGPRSVKLKWLMPSTDKYIGKLFGSEICYRKTDVKGNSCSLFFVKGEKNQAEVSGLRPSQQYALMVGGVVALGTGPYSNVLNLTTPETGKEVKDCLSAVLKYILEGQKCEEELFDLQTISLIFSRPYPTF